MKIKLKNWGGVSLGLILALWLWGCSDSGASKKEKETETFSCFEYGDDETQITGYKEEDSDSNACSLDVVIPDGVISIEDEAFEDKGLTSVTFSPTLTSIKANAFKDNDLMDITIPETVAEIGADAFTGNSFSSHVYIPNESATVDDMAFDSGVIVAIEGTDSCFEISSNALSNYYCMAQEVTVPDSVTSIEDAAFEDKGLTSVTFPQTLTSIKANAFKDNDLMDLTLPASVTNIGNNAFDENSNLAWIYIPNSSASVGTNAFPNGHGVVTNSACFEFDSTNSNQINDYYDNENEDSNDPACPKDVVIPQGVTAIGESVFEDKSLTSVTIPDSVISIGNFAFDTNSLVSVIIPDSVTSIGIAAFNSNSLTSVIIGSGITTIGISAFGTNLDLSSVCIERANAGVTLGTSAFPTSVTVDYQSDGDCFN